jgi:hypothetical protein
MRYKVLNRCLARCGDVWKFVARESYSGVKDK